MSDIPKTCKHCGEPSFNGSEDKRLFGCGTIYWFVSAAWVSGKRCHHNVVLDRDALRAEVGRLKVELQRERARYQAAINGLEHTSNQRDDARRQRDEISANRDNLRQERNEALAEVERLKQALHDARLENSGQPAMIEELRSHIGDTTKMVRPEPSRLEIAATLMAGLGFFEEVTRDARLALRAADALVEAAKGGVK